MGVQLSHALFDVEFLHKPKIKAMRRKFGDLSALWLFEVICQLSRASGAKIEIDCALSVADDFKIENGQELIDYCTNEDRKILELKNGYITNSRVDADQEKLQIRREKDLERKRKKEDSAKIPHGKSEELVTDTVTDTEDLDLKEQSDPPQYVRPGEFKLLRFSQIDYEQLTISRGERALARTIELAESHIQKQKNADPELYRKLKLQALEGKAFINGWASKQAHVDIAEVQTATARVKKAIQPYQKVDPPRPQPQEYKPPPKSADLTEEERSRNKKLVDELINKTSKKVAA